MSIGSYLISVGPPNVPVVECANDDKMGVFVYPRLETAKRSNSKS